MRKSNGCSTPAPRSSGTKQWFKQLAQKPKENQCIANWTAVILLQVLMVVGRNVVWQMRNAKGCFGSDVAVRSIRSQMSQLGTCQWWWRVTSWVRPEALLHIIFFGRGFHWGCARRLIISSGASYVCQVDVASFWKHPLKKRSCARLCLVCLI